MLEMKKQMAIIMNPFLRTGPKRSRREEFKKLETFAEYLIKYQHGVIRVENIGRRHVYEFYNYLERNKLSKNTIDKYARIITKFWEFSGRKGSCPSPNSNLH